MRNIAMLPKAKIAPAIPPPTATFAMLICGVRVSSFIAARSGSDLITRLDFQKFPDFPRLISYPSLHLAVTRKLR